MMNPVPGANKPPPEASINDDLPTGNPPIKLVLIVFGCIAAFAFVLVFRSWFGL